MSTNRNRNRSGNHFSTGTPLGRVKSNITAKLILAMVMMAVAPLLTTGFLISQNTANDVLEQTGRSTQEVAARTADLVTQILAENIHLLETLAGSSDIQFQIREANRTYAGTQQQIIDRLIVEEKQWTSTPAAVVGESRLIQDVIGESRNPVVRVLQGFKSRFPAHTLLFLTDKYGGSVASTGLLQDFYHGNEAWWQQVYREGAGAVYLSKPEIDKKTGTPVINLAIPVRNASGEVMGVLGSALDVKGIRDLLGSVKLGRTGRLMVVDREGEILFDPVRQPAPGQKVPPAFLSAEVQRKNAPGWVQFAAFDDRPTIVGYSRVSRSSDFPAQELQGWTTLAMIESEEALTPVSASTHYQLGLGLIVVLVAIGLAFFLASRFTIQIKYITQLFQEIRLGHYDRRAPIVTRDELGQMTSDLNQMLDETLVLIQSTREREELQNSIMKLLNDVSGLAEGDLTVEAEVRSDVTGAIADAFNYMTSELRQIVGKVQDVTRQVGSSAFETQSTTEQLAIASEGQSQQLLAARETIEQMTGSIQQVTEIANRSKGVAEQSLQTAKRGAEAVRDTICGMNGIRDQVQETAKRIKRLGEQSQEIGEIVRLIGDIAYRTSVLALNASIQAARSGEAGRGFAVVAEEVEQLSKRSTEASKRIGALVKVIQAGTNEAIAAMEESTQEVVEGSRLADQAGHALIEIEKVSEQLAELVESISMATEQQAQGSQAVSRTMIKLSEVTQHTTHGIKQSAVSVNNLAALANDLRASVASFKLLSNGQP